MRVNDLFWPIKLIFNRGSKLAQKLEVIKVQGQFSTKPAASQRFIATEF